MWDSYLLTPLIKTTETNKHINKLYSSVFVGTFRKVLTSYEFLLLLSTSSYRTRKQKKYVDNYFIPNLPWQLPITKPTIHWKSVEKSLSTQMRPKQTRLFLLENYWTIKPFLLCWFLYGLGLRVFGINSKISLVVFMLWAN